MMSPCATAAQTAVGPCSSVTRASHRRTASTERACIAASDSPPGNTAAAGCRCTVCHNGSSASSFSDRPCHWP